MANIYDLIPDIQMPNYRPDVVEDNDERYFASSEISNSDLPYLAKSYSHYAAYKYNESKRTKAMDIGTLTHNLIFQPNLFYAKAVMSEFEEFRTNEAKNWKKEVEAKGQMILKEADARLLNSIRDGVWTKKWVIDHLITKDVEYNIEKDFYFNWSDELPVDCRMKVDYVNHTDCYFIDLKTIQEMDSDIKNITGRSYQRQAAMYQYGLYRLTGKVYTPYYVFVEKHAPFGVKIYKISQDFIDKTIPKIETVLQKYWACYNGLDEEMSYPEEPITIDTPIWLE